MDRIEARGSAVWAAVPIEPGLTTRSLIFTRSSPAPCLPIERVVACDGIRSDQRWVENPTVSDSVVQAHGLPEFPSRERPPPQLSKNERRVRPCVEPVQTIRRIQPDKEMRRGKAPVPAGFARLRRSRAKACTAGRSCYRAPPFVAADSSCIVAADSSCIVRSVFQISIPAPARR